MDQTGTNNTIQNNSSENKLPGNSDANGETSRGLSQVKRKNDQDSRNGSKKAKKSSRQWGGQTRRERNVDSRPEAEGAEKEARKPKKKVACFIGYSGEGYHGMQYNPPMKTIEGDIYEAFAKAGAILQANATDPIKSSFQRAARTDKGVHAAGNVISLKIMLGDNNDDVVEKVNSFLPPQIRIWGIQRTINAFNSHTHCDSRVYEYIIPSHCFLPPKPGSTSAECSKEFQAQEREPEPEDNFWDSILEADFFALLKRYNANRKETTSELPDLSAEELDRFNKMRETETEAIRAFRLSPQRLERIRSAVKVYLGTHNFHNLTVGVPFNSSHAQRYMMSIDVAEPKLIGSTEWIRIKIHGQSFMLHQIRKMIGAVLLAIRYGVGEESIRQTLRTRENMHIPKAPAQGLLLERPVFSGMKEKLQKFDHEPLEWGPYEEKIEKFKDDFIYKSIFREVTSENIFHEFINFMDSFKYEQGKGLAMFVQDRQTNELAEKFEKEDEGNVKGDNENLEG